VLNDTTARGSGCRAVQGEEVACGRGDGGAFRFRDPGEQREERSGAGDAGGFDGLVKHADRVDGVAKVLERFEEESDPFGLGPVAPDHGGEHGLGQARCDADAAAGESAQVKVPEMDDGGLFADAADDQGGVDEGGQAAEVGIAGGVGSDRGVFDRADESVGDEGRDVIRFDEAVVFHVEQGGDAGCLDEAADAGGDAGAGGDALLGKDHEGGEPEAAGDAGLVHEGSIGRADRRDDEGFGACGGRQEGEGRFELGGRQVIEVGVAAVEQEADAARFEVADQAEVFVRGEGLVGAPGQGGHGHDGASEERGVERGGEHGFSG